MAGSKMAKWTTLAALLAFCALAPNALAGERQPRSPAPQPAQAGPAQYTSATDGSTFVWMPGGEFEMGSNQGNPDERPVSRVSVEGFWLGQYEVTNAQYARFVQATGHRKADSLDDPALGGPNQPVAGMTWLDAMAYCQWAGVRLPTEAEWEYAAAAGARQLAYGTATGEMSHELANCAGTEGRDRYDEATAPVGSFPPNPFGLYDMAGNAWEWTSSVWDPYPYRADDGREDINTGGFRVMRGGSWHFGPSHCRVSARHRHRHHLHYDYVGLRVAMSAAEVEKKRAGALDTLLEKVRAVYRGINEAPLSEEQKRKALATLNELSRQLKSARPNP